MGVIHLYAELLPNIKIVTVAITLATNSTSETGAWISPSGNLFFIKHDGVELPLELPARISIRNGGLLKVPKGQQELSFRFPLAAENLSCTPSNDSDVLAPWGARLLTSFANFQCRECEAPVLKPYSIRSWKDLPSENWAEMMDFWHCHKPDVGQDNVGASEKGHAVSTPGIGLVDISSFYFHPDDCQLTKVRATVFAILQTSVGGILCILAIRRRSFGFTKHTMKSSPIQMPYIKHHTQNALDVIPRVVHGVDFSFPLLPPSSNRLQETLSFHYNASPTN